MKDEAHRPRHPIQVAARRSGLNPAVLRAWERRYAAIAPWRSEADQRLYSDADIERLRHLRLLTGAGRRIGEVARLDDAQLTALLDEDLRARRVFVTVAPAGRPTIEDLIARSLACVRDRDERGLRRELERGALLYDSLVFLDDLLAPLMEQVGTAWADCSIDASHEHVASLTVRRLLEELIEKLESEAPRGRIAVAVPAGELHELGGLGLAVALASCGCDALRLGTELPAAAIVNFAHQQQVDVVAVSVTWEGNLDRVRTELAALRAGLDPGIPLLVGGWASHHVRPLVDALGALHCARVRELPQLLDRLLAQVAQRRRQDEAGEHSIAR